MKALRLLLPLALLVALSGCQPTVSGKYVGYVEQYDDKYEVFLTLKDGGAELSFPEKEESYTMIYRLEDGRVFLFTDETEKGDEIIMRVENSGETLQTIRQPVGAVWIDKWERIEQP